MLYIKELACITVVNTDPDGHFSLLDDMAYVTIIFAVASSCMSVTVAYLRSEEGQKLLKDAEAVVYNRIWYTVNQFQKLIKNGWEALKEGVKKVGKAIENFFNPGKKKEKEPKKKEKEPREKSKGKLRINRI